MRYCVFSDSHGYDKRMLQTVRDEAPEAMFFLGDGERDLKRIEKEFPDLPIYAVQGNCDYWSDLPNYLLCELDNGKAVFFTHGHLFGVKRDPEYTELIGAALQCGADIALFGHTHEAYLDEVDGVTILNPGSIGEFGEPSYAVIETDGADFTVKIVHGNDE